MVSDEERHLLRLRHTVGEITTGDLALGALLCLWARAVDRAADERAFSAVEVGDWCGRPLTESAEVLETLRRDGLVAATGAGYRLTAAGLSSLNDVVDLERVLRR